MSEAEIKSSSIETVKTLQHDGYLECGEMLGLENEFYPNSKSDMLVFAKIHMLYESGIIDETKFYTLSDAYIQYLSVKKMYDKFLLIPEEYVTFDEKNKMTQLKKEIEELECELAGYRLLDPEVNMYNVIGPNYLFNVSK